MKKAVIFVLLLFIIDVKAYTKAPIDITKMSFIEIKESLDKGIITSEQLVNLYLERIHEYNSLFNAIRVLNDNAIEDARKYDLLRKENKCNLKLCGIPILVKTNIDVYGLPTTAGTKSLSDNYPLHNSDVVQKLIDEGAIILGSTNMSELAFAANNSYSSYGSVKNVFNTEYTPFGSSGGSAVAVKASFASAALGTDTNLSVRVPASGAGLVGMRPTLYSISSEGIIPYDVERDTVGILTKKVEDNALIFSIITDKKIKIDTKNLKNITIGVLTEYTKGSKTGSGVKSLTDESIYKLVEKSIDALKGLDANIVYIDDFVKDSNLTIASTSASGLTLCDGFDEYIKGITGKIRSFKDLVNSNGYIQPIQEYISSCGSSTTKKESRDAKKKTYRDYVDSVFDKYNLDALIYPTMKNQVPLLTSPSVLSPGGSLPSVIGYPAVTVPMGTINEFSYGLEFMGKPNQEERMYNIISSFETTIKYDVNTSLLTPSLYDIPDSVNVLVETYLNGKIKNRLTEKVKQLFKNYNEIENIELKASEILKENKKVEIIISKYVMCTLSIIFIITLYALILRRLSKMQK